MATSPQASKRSDVTVDSDGNYVLLEGHRMPGWTVDALLEKGKVEEARAEMEELIMAGVNSGPGRPMTEQLFEEILANARSRAGRTNR